MNEFLATIHHHVDHPSSWAMELTTGGGMDRSDEDHDQSVPWVVIFAAEQPDKTYSNEHDRPGKKSSGMLSYIMNTASHSSRSHYLKNVQSPIVGTADF